MDNSIDVHEIEEKVALFADDIASIIADCELAKAEATSSADESYAPVEAYNRIKELIMGDK